MSPRIFLFIALLLASAGVTAEIFKWVDDEGRIYYGDTPPPEVQVQTLSDVSVSVLPTHLGTPVQAAEVIVYSTSHCPYCDRAKKDLKQRGIAYDERDVERSAQYRKEWRELGGKGVPLIVVGRNLLKGYRAESLALALQQAGL